MSTTPGSGERRISIDWDGTCVESKWPEMGEWLPGARASLHKLLRAGFEVVIFSTRLAGCDVDEATPRPEEMSREILRVREMLDAAGLHEVSIWTKPWKVGARFYVDDKAIEFTGDWGGVLRRIAETLDVGQLEYKFVRVEDPHAAVREFIPNPYGSMEPARGKVGPDKDLGDKLVQDGDVDWLVTPAGASMMRSFGTGATRNLDTNKHDYEGFVSPLCTRRFGEYMHSHRKQADGTVRDSDNWQKGIPLDAYIKSLTRHVEDLKLIHRGFVAYDPDTGDPVDLEDCLCAIRFNADGYLFETLKGKVERTEEEAA